MKVILDTDIGSDIDDAFALALALRSSEIDLIGVTTVYGDTKVRGHIAKRLINLTDKQVPVYCGLETTLLNNRPIWMAGHEGDDLSFEPQDLELEEMHAVDFIIEQIMGNPGEVTLIGIGPLTNIAMAIIKEPKIVENVREVLIMGGITRLGSSATTPESLARPTEHNITSDPEAASVVYSAGLPLTMVGLDVTMQVKLFQEDVELLANSEDKLNLEILKMLKTWFEFIEEDFTLLHDPLTVSLLLNRDLVQTKDLEIKVDYTSVHPSGQTLAVGAGKTSVALEVEVEEFKKTIMNILLKGENYEEQK